MPIKRNPNGTSLKIRYESAVNSNHYLFFKHALMKMFNLIDIGERAGSGIPKIVNIWNDYSQISKSWGQ